MEGQSAKVDHSVVDTTISNNLVSTKATPTAPHSVLRQAAPDPVKPRSCLSPERQRLAVILALVTVSVLLAGGIVAAVLFFEYTVSSPQMVFDNDDTVDYDSEKKDNEDASYVSSVTYSTDPLFELDLKAAGRQKAGESVRLEDDNSEAEGPAAGRLEIYHNGRWGTVCDDYFDIYAAIVVCRQLGFAWALDFHPNAYPFGRGRKKPKWLDDVKCLGDELYIEDCPHADWRVNDCRHNEDVGVTCMSTSMELRLTGGSISNEGRVEINVDGTWGTICDDSWDNNDAKVVCKQLGFSSESAVGVGNAQFGQGSGPIYLDEVKCDGSESSVAYCHRNRWSVHDCQHSEDAGVICQVAAPDSVSPVITSCPSNLPATSGFIYAFAGQSAGYDFPAATATDLDDNGQPTTPAISYTIQTTNPQTSQESSGQFPIGVTSVTVKAVDASGNQAESCSFTVTVTLSTASDPWEMLGQQCGRPVAGANTKVVGGDNVGDILEWPWMAYISNQYACGASLISENWAITAAHCIHGQTSPRSQPTVFTIGRLDTRVTETYTQQTVVSQIIKHEGYVSATTDNDIALLKLGTPVMFSDYVRPVCVATTSGDESVAYAEPGASCHVTGWGTLSSGGNVSPILQEAPSPIISCLGGSSSYSQFEITDNMICTSTAARTGSCQGDSGGPMMCKNAQGVWDLVGITSWGYGCANINYPDVVARVSKYSDSGSGWIREHIDLNGGP